VNSTKHLKVLCGLALGVLFSGALSAKTATITAKPEYYAIVKKMAPAREFKAEYPYLTDAQMTKLKAAIAKQRYPATTDDLRSKELQELSTTLMKISATPFDAANPSANTDRLDAFLADLEAKYSTFKSPDTKLFASQLIPLRQLRGVVWRMIGLFKTSKARAAHTASLSTFKNMAGNLRIYSPDENWRLGFDYITQPYIKNDAPVAQFKSMAEFQGFIGGPLYSAVEWSKNQLKDINVSDSSQVVVWDQQVALGPKSFVDDIGRFKKIGELEKHMLLSDMYFSLSQMAFSRAYSLDGALEMGYQAGLLFGLDSLIPGSSVEGVTSQQLHDKLKEHPRVGIEFADRQDFMIRSLDHLKNAAQAMAIVWQQAKARPTGSMWAFDTGFLKLDTEYGDRKISEFRRALSGPVTLRNGITGEEATVDIAGFYTKAPRSLADLLPKTFSPGTEWNTVTLKNSKGKSFQVDYRNYLKGSPVSWDYEKFKGLFPEVDSNEKLKVSMRVIN
jgi:hypothetical protein